MASYVKAAAVGDLEPGHGKLVEIGDKKIALFNVGGTYYAIDDTCTHRGGPLSEGELDGAEGTCPGHGGIFNVTTGAVIGGPPPQDVAAYKVRVVGADIEVEV